MICYDRLWATMDERGMTQYRLIKQHNFSAGQIGRLKKNMHVSTHTLDTLCSILECGISDLVEYIPDGQAAPKQPPRVHTAQDLLSPTQEPPEAMDPEASEEAPLSGKQKKSSSPRGDKQKKTGKSKKGEKKTPKEGKKGKDSKKNK